MAVASTIALNVSAQQSTSLDLGSAAFNVSKSYGTAFSTGTAAGQVDRLFTDTRTLSASATEDLDLAGVLTDALGATLTFARIKAVIFAAAAANTNNVQITRSASNGAPLFLAAGDGVALRPGAAFAWFSGLSDATGVAVTGGTGDLITVTNSGGTTGVTYDVIIVGCSA